MMKCKEALQATGGDEQAAIDWLRKDNIKVQESRIGRETVVRPDGPVYRLGQGRRRPGRVALRKLRRWPANAEFVALASDFGQAVGAGQGRGDGR